MKKCLIILALAVALTFAMAAPAFADHSPTFFVGWSEDSTYTGYANNFGNMGTGGPHNNYLEGTEKCAVCHSVHRAPVVGVKWDTNPADDASVTAVAGHQYDRAEFEVGATAVAAGGTTQMLLMSDVANACNYCHIDTSIGGEQLWAGKRQYITEGGPAGSEWDAGFGHHNACTGCHAVHGAGNNYGDAALYGNGIFQGPIGTKILKVRAKGAGGAGDQAYVWQDEVVAIGAAGKAELAASTIPGMAAWAAPQVVSANVDTKNVPLFPTVTDALNGTNVRPDADAGDAQVSAFCTFCHVNYGYSSEATVNPDGDRGLFQGPWYADGGVDNVDGDPGTWFTMNGAAANTAPFKNHPVKAVDGAFVAAGKGATVPSQVAYANASTCRSCHDAGVEDQVGVIVQSYPHFTPGYFHFAKGAAYAGATTLYGPVELNEIENFYAFGDAAGIAAAQAWLEDPVSYEEAITVNDGQCLKCHRDATNTFGVGKNY